MSASPSAQSIVAFPMLKNQLVLKAKATNSQRERLVQTAHSSLFLRPERPSKKGMGEQGNYQDVLVPNVYECFGQRHT